MSDVNHVDIELLKQQQVRPVGTTVDDLHRLLAMEEVAEVGGGVDELWQQIVSVCR